MHVILIKYAPEYPVMKVSSECMPCNVERAKYECDLVFKDEAKKIKMMRELFKFISANLSPESIPAYLGTNRERIVKRMSGVADPYKNLKIKSDGVAKKLLPSAVKFYEKARDKTDALVRIMATANSMEYGVMGYKFDASKFEKEFNRILREHLLSDNTKIKAVLGKYKKILYLTDNCGEIVFDIFAVKKLEEMGKEVTLAPKSEPVLNDATVDDLKRLGYKGKVIPCGSFVGVSLEEAGKEFLKALWSPDTLVIAKGMGHYEMVSEFEDRLRGRLLYILRAKCEPVARAAGVKRGELVAKMV
jgi:hypothetical protein